MTPLFRLAWERYRLFGHILGDFQGQVFNLLFYFTIMLPFGIGMRLLGDPLGQKLPARWPEREPVGNTLDDARRQG